LALPRMASRLVFLAAPSGFPGKSCDDRMQSASCSYVVNVETYVFVNTDVQDKLASSTVLDNTLLSGSRVGENTRSLRED
jgi:hypothetical protein